MEYVSSLTTVPFLIIFGILLALAVAGTFLVRGRLTGPRAGEPRVDAYPPEVVGYLIGGRGTAADAILASLCAHDVLGVVPGSRPVIKTLGRQPKALSALELAAYGTAAGRTLKGLRGRVRTLPEMDDLAADVVDRGLLVGVAARRRARLFTLLAWLPVLLFVLPGINATTVGSVHGLILVLLGVLAFASVNEVPRLRTAGADVVSALRREGREHATTNGRARFGPGGAGMAVALYGVGAMALVDPVFARYFNTTVPTHAASSAGYGCSASGLSCGGSSCGGSSCGGGSGCGSGCGGGG